MLGGSAGASVPGSEGLGVIEGTGVGVGVGDTCGGGVGVGLGSGVGEGLGVGTGGTQQSVSKFRAAGSPVHPEGQHRSSRIPEQALAG